MHVHRILLLVAHHFGDPAPHVARRLEHAGDALHFAPDRETDAVEFRQHLECRLVGHVVADEDRAASLERRVLHQLAHRGALVERGLLHLHHRFARQDLDRASRESARRSRSPRRAPRGRDAAPGDNASRPNSPCPRPRRPACRPRCWRASALSCGSRKVFARAHRAVVEAQLRAMAGDRRQLERREEQVEFGERPPADERERAAGALATAVRARRSAPAGRRPPAGSERDRESSHRHRAKWRSNGSVAASMNNSRSRLRLLIKRSRQRRAPALRCADSS